MKLNIELLLGEKMPINCFNRVTGFWIKHKPYKVNHIFGVKGIFGVVLTITRPKNYN